MMKKNHKSIRLALWLASLLFSCPVLPPVHAASFLANPPMHLARRAHTASLLLDGKVLVAGGEGTNGFLASAELYDPAAGNWLPTGSLTNITGYATNVPSNIRAFHTATLLANGKVLVVGGLGTTKLASAQLYDPVAGTWTETGFMNTARYQHTATLLPNGKVLVAGGINTVGDSIASAELYDPATGLWTEIGPMNNIRWQHTATLLPNGKVLIVAGGALVHGVSFNVLVSAELYDPATGTWTDGGNLHVARYDQKAVLLSNGKVLVIGGFDGVNAISSTELYDPTTGTWTNSGALNVARDTPQATLLADGKVLVTGGYNSGSSGTYLSSAEIYDPAPGTWTTNGVGVMSDQRWQHTATLLVGGRVLFTGGYGGGVLASTELYDSGGPLIYPPQLSGMSMSNGVFRFVLNGPVGSNYVIQASSNLINWADMFTNTIPPGGLTNLLIPNTAGKPQEFFQVVP